MSRPMVTAAVVLLAPVCAARRRAARTLQARIARVTTARGDPGGRARAAGLARGASQGELRLTRAQRVDARTWATAIATCAGAARCSATATAAGAATATCAAAARRAVAAGGRPAARPAPMRRCRAGVDARRCTGRRRRPTTPHRPHPGAAGLGAGAAARRRGTDGQLKAGTLDGRLTRARAEPAAAAGRRRPRSDRAPRSTRPTPPSPAENLGGRLTIDYRKTPQFAQRRRRRPAARRRIAVRQRLRRVAGDAGGVRVEGRAAGERRAGSCRASPGATATRWSPKAAPRFDRQRRACATSTCTCAATTSRRLPTRYLSGWLGAGRPGRPAAARRASMRAVRIAGGRLQAASAAARRRRRRSAGALPLRCGSTATPRFSATAPVASELRWRGGAAVRPGLRCRARCRSTAATASCACATPVTVPMLGGSLRFDGLTLRPPAGGDGHARCSFGLALDRLDIGRSPRRSAGPRSRASSAGASRRRAMPTTAWISMAA